MNEDNYNLPVGDSVKTAWAKVKGSKCTFWAILGYITLIRLVMFGGEIILRHIEPGILSIIISVSYLVLLILATMLSWGLIYLGIVRAADQPINYKMAKVGLKIGLLFRMIGLYILEFLVFIPVIALVLIPSVIFSMIGGSDAGTATTVVTIIVTAAAYIAGALLGLYLAVRLYVAKLILIAQAVNPWVAIKLSFKATKSNVLNLIGLIIINILIMVLSVCTLGILFIWTLPYLFINNGVIYNRLVTLRQNTTI
jgi:hypothetical protein